MYERSESRLLCSLIPRYDCSPLSAAMDPLLVLPTELLHRIVLLLPLGDRVRLWEVSRGWRAFVGDASLWRRVALRLDGADSLRVLLRAPCVNSVTLPRARSPQMDSARLRRAFRSGIQVSIFQVTLACSKLAYLHFRSANECDLQCRERSKVIRLCRCAGCVG